VCTKELQRFRHRKSCRVQDVWALVDRLAAAGIRHNNPFEEAVCTALQAKRIFVVDTAMSTESSLLSPPLPPPVLDLFATRSALLLWEFSTRQRKQRSFWNQAAQHWESSSSLSSSSLPSPQSLFAKQQKSDPFETVGAGAGNDDDESHCTAELLLQQLTTSSSQERSLFLDWKEYFADPHRPLVIDIGCGMGVSLLGLACLAVEKDNSSSILSRPAWYADCNFLGVDLNRIAMGYAVGIAQRWNMQHRLAFVVSSAEDILRQVQASYPGRVCKVLIQFPTPYRLRRPDENDDDDGAAHRKGNLQLPKSVTDGFMVTPGLLQQINVVLTKDQNDSCQDDAATSPMITPPGELWIQSNCEDVAVWMRNTACQEAGFAYVPANRTEHDKNTDDLVKKITTLAPTQRTLNWIAMGGECAQGPGWIASPLLPRRAMTETEVACRIKGTPVHRCIVVPMLIK